MWHLAASGLTLFPLPLLRKLTRRVEALEQGMQALGRYARALTVRNTRDIYGAHSSALSNHAVWALENSPPVDNEYTVS